MKHSMLCSHNNLFVSDTTILTCLNLFTSIHVKLLFGLVIHFGGLTTLSTGTWRWSIKSHNREDPKSDCPSPNHINHNSTTSHSTLSWWSYCTWKATIKMSIQFSSAWHSPTRPIHSPSYIIATRFTVIECDGFYWHFGESSVKLLDMNDMFFVQVLICDTKRGEVSVKQ